MNHYLVTLNYHSKPLPRFLKWVLQNMKDRNILLFCKQFLEEIRKWTDYKIASTIKSILPGSDRDSVEPGHYDYQNMPGFAEKKGMLEQMLGIDERYSRPETREKYEMLEKIMEKKKEPVTDFVITDEGYFQVNGKLMDFITENEFTLLQNMGISVSVIGEDEMTLIDCEDKKVRESLMAVRGQLSEEIGKTKETERESHIIAASEQKIARYGEPQGPYTCAVLDSGFEAVYDLERRGYFITDIPDHTVHLSFPSAIRDMDGKEFPVIGIGLPGMDTWSKEHFSLPVQTITIPETIREINLLHAFTDMTDLRSVQGMEHVRDIHSKDFARNSMNLSQLNLSQTVHMDNPDCIPKGISIRYVSAKEREGYTDPEPDWKLYAKQTVERYDPDNGNLIKENINPLQARITGTEDFVTFVHGNRTTFQAVSLDSGFKAIFNEEMGGYLIAELPMDDRDILVFPNTITDDSGKEYPVVAVGMEGTALCNELSDARKIVIPENISCMDGKVLQNLPELEEVEGFSHICDVTGEIFAKSMKLERIEVNPELADKEENHIPCIMDIRKRDRKKKERDMNLQVHRLYDEENVPLSSFCTDDGLYALYDERTNGFYLYEYCGSDKMLVIPEHLEIDGYQVPVLGFCQNHNFHHKELTYVSVPETFTVIPDNFLCGCPELVEVRGLEHVTAIGEQVLSGCPKLKYCDISPDNCNCCARSALQNNRFADEHPEIMKKLRDVEVVQEVTILEEPLEQSEERADFFIPVNNTEIVSETKTVVDTYVYDRNDDRLMSYESEEYMNYGTVNRDYDMER